MPKNKRIDLEMAMSIIALIASGIAILLTIAQMKQTTRLSKEEKAIEAVEILRDEKFLSASAKLASFSNEPTVKSQKGEIVLNSELLEKLFKNGDDLSNENSLIEDLNYVMASYNYVSQLYNSGLVEKQIVQKHFYNPVVHFDQCLGKIETVIPINRTFFDELLTDLSSNERH